ncbi:hypothetical protein CDD81_338 [Ophiocordyceps australis]|uniref:DNA repair metallo-beta-lactamase domain-containing protein n=1 Tax=Ophiocordyceps australis TaxID=1399860 RepID=A0A2C5Y3M3_9HYPO|nr:hypothetical protein CDD81_338 [Ophiocordyceps australis]
MLFMVATLKQVRRRPAAGIKPNTSILSFFRPAEKQEESLFVGSRPVPLCLDGGENRFNESNAPSKKQRLSVLSEAGLTVAPTDSGQDETSNRNSDDDKNNPASSRPTGLPFVFDSDSDDEPDESSDSKRLRIDAIDNAVPDDSRASLDEIYEAEQDDQGEETRLMRLFAAEEGDASLLDDGQETMIDTCPICDYSLSGCSSDDATRHVNMCLDSNGGESVPSPPPQVHHVDSSLLSKRFARAAIPKPAQANPLPIDDCNPDAKTAFSTLMSGNAEDSAWATAAAAEHASHGRPAYQRTCPFYKIIPGFNICVDAFRYGAVQGCEAYFLSHFHSDHYMGLTANWTHGPIYCSGVTGRLVKQQLRTAAKWVVELEFDKSYDIPGTDASVTMIAANHCPGSSLFLFQKFVKTAASQRVQRILHCGDFRACPAHIAHPLLKPDIVEAVTGKMNRQSINVCYLDTTYLNPRYSFPPQEHVIKACADLCASMSPDPDCKDDVWDRSSRAAGDQAVSKFFHETKTERLDGSEKKPARSRQRLLVVCGTYSIGKERICVAIAKALGSKIFVTSAKAKIFRQLQDAELTSLLTSDPLEAQVHMQSLMEIRAETLQDYLSSYKPHFSRIVGFRPSGWTFRPSNGKTVGANTPPGTVATQEILHGKGWRTSFGYKDLMHQRGSTKEAMCFGVPYSEHSSFRELAMFIMALRIEKVIPTVNVGSEQSRKRMKGWIDRWMAERRRGGLIKVLVEGSDEDEELWQGDPARGRGVWW